MRVEEVEQKLVDLNKSMKEAHEVMQQASARILEMYNDWEKVLELANQAFSSEPIEHIKLIARKYNNL